MPTDWTGGVGATVQVGNRTYQRTASGWVPYVTSEVVSAPRLKPGRYYSLWNGTGFGGVGYGVGTMVMVPLFVPVAASIDRIGCRATATAAGTTIRYGIYADDGYGHPGDLQVDFGASPYSIASDVSTTGNKDETISPAYSLSAGLWWRALAVQGSNTATLLAYTQVAHYPASASSPADFVNGVGCLAQTGVTGALPATFSGTAVNANPPYLWVRAA